MGAEARRDVGGLVGEERLEEIRGVRQITARVGRHVDDDLLLVGLDCLRDEFVDQFVDGRRHLFHRPNAEGGHAQHSDVLQLALVQQVAGQQVVVITDGSLGVVGRRLGDGRGGAWLRC